MLKRYIREYKSSCLTFHKQKIKSIKTSSLSPCTVHSYLCMFECSHNVCRLLNLLFYKLDIHLFFNLINKYLHGNLKRLINGRT